ncbi:MAG TPA: coenzyme F420-0:L-glutamate ligase [Mycobacteriales bacterium]|jgi:coenzyme F420-0:L-glutamate ligase/coenzyme F420-1:gamma-L-glutamate ligase|nr:coenzyme F420-0:L-glutamate ligase [Mycobacteriales bacterium]
MTSKALEVWALDGIPEVQRGDDLAALIVATGAELRDGDVVVVTSKIVSKSEGRLVEGSREEHLAGETVRVVARRGKTQIVQTRHGFVLAAAGIDASNVPAGTVALLPLDSDVSACTIRAGLLELSGADVAVIVTDTMGRPWRDGVVDNAIGAAGIEVLDDLRGSTDSYGQILEVTVTALADELAAAADLVKGKLEGRPVAVIRGYDVRRPKDDDHGARPLVRAAADDMFASGTHDAVIGLVRDSAPVAASSGGPVDVALVGRAVGALGAASVAMTVADDGTSVSASGSALEVGYALGRLMAALAAEGLRATSPTETADGAHLEIRRAD